MSMKFFGKSVYRCSLILVVVPKTFALNRLSVHPSKQKHLNTAACERWCRLQHIYSEVTSGTSLDRVTYGVQCNDKY